jgi:UDP-2,3-diacylglucosamine pyrophosphatase LpxH
MIVAVSDIHLGKYKESETLFRAFLDDVKDNPHIEHVVLIGDILDMWKGDADTILTTYKDILEILRDLHTETRTVSYIVGNHDYHMIRRNDITQFHVYPHVTLLSGTKKYFFIHGYQFEYPNDIRIYEAFANLLCFGGDIMGATVDFFWDLYKETMTAVTMPKQWFYENFERAKEPPPKRLMRKDIKRIYQAIKDKRIKDKTVTDTFVVFGHTHDPFVDETCQIANAGSWVDDPKYPHLEKYTYITIEEGTMNMESFV